MFTHDYPYWRATKHPWACVCFVLPLLAIYEIGVYVNGPSTSEEVRNGADAWLRAALAEAGVSPVYGAPCLLVLVLFLWGWLRREGRPLDRLGVWIGMTVESAMHALVLVGLSQGLWQVLLRADQIFGRPGGRGLVALLQWSSEAGQTGLEPVWAQIISYFGAGIYEETLFRLLIYAGLLRLFSWADVPTSFNVILAAFASALLFAGAHHLGPHGDVFNFYVFAFRTFAGMYFAGLYQVRGFGIAVGAHAGYDVLVGLIMQM
jgi:membrane protease YdiL (CAAX protease family)